MAKGRVTADELFVAVFELLRQRLRARGIRVTPTSGYRTLAEQLAVFKRKGPKLAAKPGSSFHNWGFALDVSIAPVRWDVFGAEAEAMGFRWGGRFSTPEPWHIDLGSMLDINAARTIFDRAYLREVR